MARLLARRKRRSKRQNALAGGTGGADVSQELTQEELAKQLDDYSDRISTQVRTVNFGVLGLTWLLLVPKAGEGLIIAAPRRALLAITLLCILAILTEFGQYLLAERAVDETFDRAVESASGKAAYDAAALTYRLQLVCYRLKLLLTFVAAAVLIFVLARALLSDPGP